MNEKNIGKCGECGRFNRYFVKGAFSYMPVGVGYCSKLQSIVNEDNKESCFSSVTDTNGQNQYDSLIEALCKTQYNRRILSNDKSLKQ